MKRFYIYLLFIFTVPLLGHAQFTGFIDDSGMNVPSYSIENNLVGNSTEVVGNNGNEFIKNENNFADSNEVNINVRGSNRICNVGRKTLNGYVDYIGCIIRVSILPFIFTLALLTFVWGVTVMMRHPDNADSQKEGRVFILWGIIGFFVITSVYALVAILRRTVGFGENFEKDTTPYIQLKEKVQKLK